MTSINLGEVLNSDLLSPVNQALESDSEFSIESLIYFMQQKRNLQKSKTLFNNLAPEHDFQKEVLSLLKSLSDLLQERLGSETEVQFTNLVNDVYAIHIKYIGAGPIMFGTRLMTFRVGQSSCMTDTGAHYTTLDTAYAGILKSLRSAKVQGYLKAALSLLGLTSSRASS